MSDYLRSALGYLNGNGNSNEYVGQVLEINNVKLRVTRLLAEGESRQSSHFLLFFLDFLLFFGLKKVSNIIVSFRI